MTKADTKLYLEASQRLIAELRETERSLLEQGGSLSNITLLCPDRLASFEQATSYLGAYAVRQFMDSWAP